MTEPAVLWLAQGCEVDATNSGGTGTPPIPPDRSTGRRSKMRSLPARDPYDGFATDDMASRTLTS
jgi:hypothetical protein